MSPQQFKAAGLGPANDAIVLKAARQSKPVSALAVDEYNLSTSLPKGYVREGERFVFKASRNARSERTKTELAETICHPAARSPSKMRMSA
jgi:hypothetical protein